MSAASAALLQPSDTLLERHLGSNEAETAAMLAEVGHASLDALVDAAVPPAIRLCRPLDLPAPSGESDTLRRLRAIADKNRVYRSYLGGGYSDCLVPPVIQRNHPGEPAWYTSYTPYQAEISQGRLEALLNFQSLVTDLTGMEIANASLPGRGDRRRRGDGPGPRRQPDRGGGALPRLRPLPTRRNVEVSGPGRSPSAWKWWWPRFRSWRRSSTAPSASCSSIRRPMVP